MTNDHFSAAANQKYFNGHLSQNQLLFLSELDSGNSEAVEFAEGVLSRMKRIHLDAKDIPELLFWETGSIIPKILPGAWGGIVPPITFPNRHIKVEEYMGKNKWNSLQPGNTVLDMGCGFPPLTAIDLSKYFPEVNIIGADPSFGKYTVTDKDGNYACLLEDGNLKYLQPANISSSQWNDVFDDLEETKKRFLNLFQQLKIVLPEQEDPETFEERKVNGNTIVRNPLRKYSSANLRFEEQGIGSNSLPKNLDMIRCMNVLLYFDPAFRNETLQWAAIHLKEGGLFICGLNYSHSVNCRFSVYQKQNGKMQLVEFTFSIENIRPYEMVTFFSFRDDDFEQDQLLKHAGLIRSNERFMKEFNPALDHLLQQNKICRLKEDGYLSFIDTNLPPLQLQLSMRQTSDELSNLFAAKAVDVLKQSGKDAWVNEIGFISVRNP